jgi:DNA (cytosine-5)-methyltransferase 1
MIPFIDLFCGAGGFAKGFELTNKFKCVGGIDIMPAAIDTHSLNFPDSISICDDIRKIEPEDFHSRIGNKKVELIIGGPPCPTFSTIGHAKIQSVNKDLGKDITTDPRNILFMDFLKYVRYFNPKMFVMENVPQFLTKHHGATFQAVKQIIKRDLPEYSIIEPVQVLNSVNYGVPQSRRRMILVGYLNGVSFKYPDITHSIVEPIVEDDLYSESVNRKSLKSAVTVKSAIADLPLITDNWRISECEYKTHHDLDEYQKLMRANTGRLVSNNICRMSNSRAKRVFEYMKQGDRYMDLPDEVRKILPFREDIFKDRLKRLKENEPSWTIIAHIGMDGYMYIHPWENRTLSVREAARIQSFPDDFIFIGNQQDTYVQVGNAVPPLLAQAVAGEIYKSYLNNPD